MFATLDDLEGRVELFVRDAAGEPAQAIVVDSVVVVRGRVDHKGRGETSIVVQEAEVFEPDADELAAARARRGRDPQARPGSRSRSTPSRFGSDLVEELKTLFESFPGETEVVLEMKTREGAAPAALRRRLQGRPVAGAARRARPAAGPASARGLSRHSAGPGPADAARSHAQV